MDFLADSSVQRILIIAGGVLGLFAVYFLLAVLSNRSVQRLADSIRRRRNPDRTPVVVRPVSKLFSLPWAVLILLAAAGGLVTMLIYTTRALR